MITIKSGNKKIYNKFIDNGLIGFNATQREWFRGKAYQSKSQDFYAFDGDKLIGGAVGFVKYKWYFLSLLFIEEKYRNHGIGSQLMREIENYAKKENLTGVRLETWDFQARGFYEKNGYELFGEIHNCPPQITEYLLKKELK